MLDKNFFKKSCSRKDETYQGDVTSSEDDITTNDDDDVTTTNSDVKATQKKGFRCKTPDPNQDLGVITLLASFSRQLKNCLQGAPNSP